MTTEERNSRAKNIIDAYHGSLKEFYEGSAANAHMAMAKLASVPIVLTPHLLYQLHANFHLYKSTSGSSISIPEIAVSDCILSNLFQKVGAEIFEMDAVVRELLLNELNADVGEHYIKEKLAPFVLQYSAQNTGDRFAEYFNKANRWAAIMAINQKLATEEILNALVRELENKNINRGIGITNLIDALYKGNADIAALLNQSLKESTPSSTSTSINNKKRLIITDNADENSVNIPLPLTIGKRLESIVVQYRTAMEVADKLQEKTEHLFALIVDVPPQHNEGEVIDRETAREIKELFIKNSHWSDNTMTLLEGENATASNFIFELNTLFDQASERDIVFLYFQGDTSGQPGLFMFNEPQTRAEKGMALLSKSDFKEIINRRSSAIQPFIVAVIDTQTNETNWLDENNPKHICITPAFTGYQPIKGELTRNLLDVLRRDARITYKELYKRLINGAFALSKKFALTRIPFFQIAEDAWDKYFLTNRNDSLLEKIDRLWIRNGGEWTQEKVKLLEDTARQIKLDNRVETDAKLLEVLNRMVRMEKAQRINIVSLLSQYVDFDSDQEIRQFMRKMSVQHKGFLWEKLTLPHENYRKVEGEFAKFLRSLKDVDIVLIGFSADAIKSGRSSMIEMVDRICFVLDIEVFLIIEDGITSRSSQIAQMKTLPVNQESITSSAGRSKFRTDFRQLLEEYTKHRSSYSKNIAKKPTTYGVAVSIGQYQSSRIVPIHSSGDADMFRNGLLNANLSTVKNFKKFVNKEAKLQAVKQEFQKLLRKAESKDVVIFYFSGHATNQGRNELYFYDYDSEGSPEIGIWTDAEFRQFVRDNADNDPTVIVILDTHSGSADWLSLDNPGHILLMCTHLGESSPDDPQGGWLTNALVRETIAHGHRITYRTLYNSVINQWIESFINDRSENKLALPVPKFVMSDQNWDRFIYSDVSEERDSDVISQLINQVSLDFGKRYSQEEAIARFKDKFQLSPRDDLKTELRKAVRLSKKKTLTVAFINAGTNEDTAQRIEQYVGLNQAAFRVIYDAFLSPTDFSNLSLVMSRELVECDVILVGLNPRSTEGMWAQRGEKLYDIAFALDKPIYFIVEEPLTLKELPFIKRITLPTNGLPASVQDGNEQLNKDLTTIITNLNKYLQKEEYRPDNTNWAIVIDVNNYSNEMLRTITSHSKNNADQFYDWLCSPGGNFFPDQVFRVSSTDEPVGHDMIDHAIEVTLSKAEMMKHQGKLYVYISGACTQQGKYTLSLSEKSNSFQNYVIDIEDYVDGIKRAGIFEDIIGIYDLAAPAFFEFSAPRPPTFKIRQQEITNTRIFAIAAWTPEQPTTDSLTSQVIKGLKGEAAEDGVISGASLVKYLSGTSYIFSEATGEQQIILVGQVRQREVVIHSNKRLLGGRVMVFDGNDNLVTEWMASGYEKMLTLKAGIYKLETSSAPVKKTIEVLPGTTPLHFNLNYQYKERYVTIVGTGVGILTKQEEWVSNSIGNALAREGFGIINGGWKGVDEIVGQSFEQYFSQTNQPIPDKAYRQILSQEQPLLRENKNGEFVQTNSDWRKQVVKASEAVIVIGGKGGSWSTAQEAFSVKVPVIPVTSTGGDALKAFNKIKKSVLSRGQFSTSQLEKLNIPINSTDDAEKIVEEIIALLDEKAGAEEPFLA